MSETNYIVLNAEGLAALLEHERRDELMHFLSDGVIYTANATDHRPPMKVYGSNLSIIGFADQVFGSHDALLCAKDGDASAFWEKLSGDVGDTLADVNFGSVDKGNAELVGVIASKPDTDDGGRVDENFLTGGSVGDGDELGHAGSVAEE